MKNIGTLSPCPRADYRTLYITAKPRFPILTVALVIANLAIWTIMSRPGEPEAAALVNAYAFSPVDLTKAVTQENYAVAAREGICAFSSLFVHEYDFSHVAINMAFLVLFGISVERRLGRQRYAVLYLATGVLTCVAYLVICPDGKASFGASSAVCGVLGAYVTLFLKKRPFTSLIPLAVLALNVYCATRPELIAQTGFTFFAHIIGFVLGALGALCLAPAAVRPTIRA